MIHLDLESLAGRVGEEIAVSDWLEISQARIDQFAAATDDHQWIHVDPTKAAASPFKSTIAHGFLTLSLISALLWNAVNVRARMMINYGANRVRFVTPVPSGSRVRGRFSPASVARVEDGVQVVWNVTIEREGQEKPCVVVEWIVRYSL